MNRIAILTLLAFCVAQPAQAKNPTRTQPVSVADLDLADQADQARLDRRIKRAVFAVCGPKIVGDGVRNEAIDNCRSEALANASRDAAMIIAARDQRAKLAVRGQ